MFSESRWLAQACGRHEAHISQVTGKCAARSGQIGGYPNSWHFYADLIYHFYWTEKPRKPDGPASAVSGVYILRTPPESAPLRSGFLGLSPKSPKPARVRGKSHGWVTCILRFQDPRLAACLCLSPIREPSSHNQWPEKFIHITEFYIQLTRSKNISLHNFEIHISLCNHRRLRTNHFHP